MSRRFMLALCGLTVLLATGCGSGGQPTARNTPPVEPVRVADGKSASPPKVPSVATGEIRKPGYAKKDGLSLTIRFDKKTYEPGEKILLRFALKNELGTPLSVADGFMAPEYHEVGPYRHFEVHLKTGGTEPLYFWSGALTEGGASAVRRVFELKPGEEYKGTISFSEGMASEMVEDPNRPPDLRTGGVEDKIPGKDHVLGKDGREYTVELLYRVHVSGPETSLNPEIVPPGLWTGKMTTGPLGFKIGEK